MSNVLELTVGAAGTVTAVTINSNVITDVSNVSQRLNSGKLEATLTFTVAEVSTVTV